MLKHNTLPAADGFHMPAEYEKHYGTLMIWPTRPGSWSYGGKKAQIIFSDIIQKIAKGEEVFVLVPPNEMEHAGTMLQDPHIHLLPFETDDAWARDTGATYVISKDARRGIDWQFNAWGGTYDGLYKSWENDQKVASYLTKFLENDIYDVTDFVLEGGSIHCDGEGTILTTEECLLSPGRNPHLTKEQIEQKLKDYLGAQKVIWLPYGIYNDETNGHVDNFCCFTSPGEVVLAWTDDKEDPQYERSIKAFELLQSETDAQGRSIKIHKLYIPKNPVCIKEEDLQGLEFEDGEDEREVGERLAASYVNFYICNAGVLVPQFGDIHDAEAITVLNECFPKKRIIPIAARDILTGGGNIHCITQQIPAI